MKNLIKTAYNFKVDFLNIKSSHLNAFVLLSNTYTKLFCEWENESNEAKENELSEQLDIIACKMKWLLLRQDLPLEQILGIV